MLFTALSALHFGNVRLMDAVLLRQFMLRSRAAAYVVNVAVRQFSIPVVKPVVMAALNRCVFVVVILRSYAQVVRIHARRIVASVHHDHTVRNLANKEFIGVAVSAYRNFTGHQKDAVPVLIRGAIPQPATRSFLDAIFKRILWPKDFVFRKASAIALPVVTGAAEFASDGVFVAADGTVDFSSNLIGHGAS